MLAESLSIAVAGLQTHRGEIEVARKGRVRVPNKAHKGSSKGGRQGVEKSRTRPSLSPRRGGRDPAPAHIAFAYAFSHA